MSPPSAAWHPDPSGRHQWRWWDGSAWTDHVADDGEVGVDAPARPAPDAAGTAGDPGDTGEASETGDAGEAGATGEAGEAGEAGATGATGDPAERDGRGAEDPPLTGFRPGLPAFLVRRDDGPRRADTAGAVVAGLPDAAPDGDGGPPGAGPAGEVLAAIAVPAVTPPLGRGVPDLVAGARVVVQAADGAVLLTVTRPDARPTVVVSAAPAAAVVGPQDRPPLTATREDGGRRRAVVFRCGGAPCGRLEPDDVLGRRWILSDTAPRASVHRRITREADRRRWAAVEYEVRVLEPAPAVPSGRARLDAATLWVVGAVLALDLLDTQLPDRDD
jgi:hypothetical protein